MFNAMVKRSFRRAGFDLQRFNPVHSLEARFNAMLAGHGINIIFDVGANVGQFARLTRDAGFAGRIVSFEPQSAAWKQLAEASKSDPLWTVAPRTAIGSEDGEITMNIAGNSFSSSILEILSTHVAAAPSSRYVSTETAPIARLDTIAASYFDSDSKLLIKMDTQGFEDRVLKGAPATLKRAVGLQMELMLTPLYAGQCGYDDMLNEVKALGFDLWDIYSNFVHPESGRSMSVDAIFFRR